MPEDSPELTKNYSSTAWSLAERLMRIPGALSQLDQPEEFVTQAAQAVAAALNADFVIHWCGPHEELPAPAGPNCVRLILAQQDMTFAAIDLKSREPFTPKTIQVIKHLASDLTLALDTVTYRKIRSAQRALTAIMRSEDELEELTNNAIAMCVEQTGAEAGLFLAHQTTNFRVLASVGDWPADPDSSPAWQAAALSGIKAASSMTHPEGLVTCPVASSSPARLVIVLRFPLNRTLRKRFPILDDLARTAAPYLDARQRDMVLTQLLELNRIPQETSTLEIYRSVLRTAVQLIPGSTAGTLLIRPSPEEPFEYKAATGFDLKGLKAHKLSEAAMRAWYGPDEHGWKLGLPRILSRNEVDLDAYGLATTPGADPLATAYGTIQSTLCLPVLRDGVVMAALNLDNLTDPNAFSYDSSRLAYLFGSPLASLLHRQQTHDLLHKAALTDELTGLANRRAFDQALTRELARAARTGNPPSVLLMDARGFKLINDHFGHDVGDEALILMARALEGGLRATDLPARRGGDEFVALLVDTPADEAALIARRVQDAISRIIIREDIHLAVNVGVATVPADGDTAIELLRIADERMYLQKLAPR